MSHGTIEVDKKLDVYSRLRLLYASYLSMIVADSVHEVHIEQLPRRCHIFTHYSVGIIGIAARVRCPDATIAGDIAVKSWQKHAGWDNIKADWKTLGFASEDEMAAVSMGLYYVETKI